MSRTQVRVSPTQAREKWVSRIGAATQEMTQGVQRVTVAPGQAAAAKFDKWLAGVQAGAEKWRRNVASVPLGQWQDSMVKIGIPRVSTGAQQKAGKYEAFASEFYPFLEGAMKAVHAMPDTTLDQRIQKSAEMQRRLSQFKRSGSHSGVGTGA